MTTRQLIRDARAELGGKGLAVEIAGCAGVLVGMAIIAFGAAALSPSVEPASRLDGFSTSIAIAGER